MKRLRTKCPNCGKPLAASTRKSLWREKMGNVVVMWREVGKCTTIDCEHRQGEAVSVSEEAENA